ncbi:unnamed protein product [Fusarium langsethiae]|nr:unnamed protein product [Fusarium langsethiae]
MKRRLNHCVEWWSFKRATTRLRVSQRQARPLDAKQGWGRPALKGMRKYMRRLNLDRYANRLKVIHVTGTKGKGSTCAFCSSLLSAHGDRKGSPVKVGMYLSPHLVDETERICINGQPISKAQFAKHAWNVIKELGISVDPEAPRFLQAMILIAIRVFQEENVDVAIIETHTGARYCATNFWKRPVVVGITHISLDHQEELGETIAKITYQKAGIFKRGVPAFTTARDPDARPVLLEEAKKNRVQLSFVDSSDKQLRDLVNIEALRENLQLATNLCNTVLKADGDALDESDITSGVANFNYPGRFQTLESKNATWYLDGAHNPSSVAVAVNWFGEQISRLSS